MDSSVRQTRRWVLAVTAAMLISATAATVEPRASNAAAAAPTGAFVAIGPARLADTRLDPCGCVNVDESTITIDIAGHPAVPDGAIAVAIVVTATATSAPGFVTVFPDGRDRPLASSLNTRTDRVVANSVVVEVGSGGRIALARSHSGDLVVDVTGAFVAATTARAGRFVPVASRRVADTRVGSPVTGPLPAGGELTVPLPAEVAPDATALAVTVTSVGDESPGYLTSHPSGSPPNATSFLNVNGAGQAVAATTILPVAAGGLTIASLHRGHVVVDLLGWFTGPSAPVSGDGLFQPIGPQRLLDTREVGPRAWPGGTVELATSWPGAGSLVTNVTVTASDRAGFVTAFAAGTPLPDTSTLNPAMLDHTLANLAITQLSTRGLAYFARSGADVVVDVTGMFTGTPVTATAAPRSNAPGRSRVLMVGDSTLAAVPLYSWSKAALRGFDPIVDAASCRRLSRPSCLSAVTGVIPNTAVEAILETPGNIDVVVIKTGYNDWFSDFPTEFDAVVRAARAKGAHTIVWLNYTEEGTHPSRPQARQAFRENNVDLHRLVTLPQYSDVVLADWRQYVRTAPSNWTWDGSHLTEYGAWLQTDYIARFVAAIEHRPCPMPWGPGGPLLTPCPKPELVGAVPNVAALY